MSLRDKIETLEAANADLEFKLHDFETGYRGAMKLLQAANDKTENLKSLLRRSLPHVQTSYQEHHRLEDHDLLKAIKEAL